MKAIIKDVFKIKEKTFIVVEGEQIAKGMKLTINDTTMEVLNSRSGKLQTLEINCSDAKLLNACKDIQIRFSGHFDNNTIEIDDSYLYDDKLRSKLSTQRMMFLLFVSPILIVAGIFIFKHVFYAFALWLVVFRISDLVMIYKYNAIYVGEIGWSTKHFGSIVLNAKENKWHTRIYNLLSFLLAVLLIYFARFMPI